MIGQSIAHYRVISRLGAGGMGEVYRATDSKLGREVALKVLPQAVAADPDRMARFEREAQMLAALNHANVAAIYGLEESDGTRALVMELVEGPTLADRIAQGPLPIDETLAISRQVAEALEFAHDRGIIHRDLKPANVKLTSDGKVKVLDFGLAKALADDPISSPGLAHSPTLTLAATKAGIILGTAAYMAPEQAKGKSVDRRADIWSFGVLVYEMLTGQQLYSGETVSETMANVITQSPNLDSLPASTPGRLRHLLERCLSKDPRQRLQAVGEARIALEEIIANPQAALHSAAAQIVAAPQPFWRRRLPWAVADIFALAALTLAVVVYRGLPAQDQVLHAAITPPDGAYFALLGTSPGPVAISPNGRLIAFSATDAGHKTLLYVRRLDAGEAQPLSGTDGAAYPFWSPDSRWIAFFAGGKLKKIEASGGPPVTLCDASNGKGGTWNRDGDIVFAPAHNTVLHRVSAAGGNSTALTQLNKERSDNSHRHPRFLPDGRHFLFLARSESSDHSVVVGSLDGGVDKALLKANSAAAYASGYLLFIREKTLLAQAFDPGSFEFQGDPTPLVENVMSLSAGAVASVFSVSDNGVLVYETGAVAEVLALEWLDRKGNKIGTLGDKAEYREVSISPDGQKAAVTIADPRNGTWDIWIYEIARNLRTRFTFRPQIEQLPVWSPDSKSLIFGSSAKGTTDLYVKSVTGTAAEEPLFESSETKWPGSWSPDGKYVAYSASAPNADSNIWALPLTGDRKPIPVAKNPYLEFLPVFSPDGKWLAYTSNESGRWEVVVVPFPNPTRKFQVSLNGGSFPQWRRGGKEILYQTQEGAVMSVEVSARADQLEVGAPQHLFDASPSPGPQSFVSAAPDAQKFLVVSAGGQLPNRPMQLVVNWPAKLKK